MMVVVTGIYLVRITARRWTIPRGISLSSTRPIHSPFGCIYVQEMYVLLCVRHKSVRQSGRMRDLFVVPVIATRAQHGLQINPFVYLRQWEMGV